MSRDPGRSRGFAFVEMATADQAREAARALDGQIVNGRSLRVQEAHPPKSRFGGFVRATGQPRGAAGDSMPRRKP